MVLVLIFHGKILSSVSPKAKRRWKEVNERQTCKQDEQKSMKGDNFSIGGRKEIKDGKR